MIKITFFRFLNNETDIEKVRKCFAGLWSLEDDSMLMSAIESPELFVLKPQREGGGVPMMFNLHSNYRYSQVDDV